MSNNIKLILFYILLCFSSLSAGAQNAPTWVNPAVREMSYPPGAYFSEFTQGNLRQGESVSSLLERLKMDAKRGAAGNIRTMIESQVEKIDRQVTENQDFNFYSIYQDYTQQSVQADIAGFSVESYYDEKKQWGYAIAYVRKSELADYYKAQITFQLKQVENGLTHAANAIDAGQKAKARLACEQALQPMAKAEFAQDLLTAIAPQDTANLQIARLARLKERLLQSLIDLEQSTYIYLQCSETNYGESVRILEPELKRLLSANQCSFTDNSEEADYKITITATTRQHDGNVIFGNGALKFSLADVEVEVYSKYKQKVVYSDGISQKNNGDGATYESAGRNALKLAAATVFKGIKPLISGNL